MKKLPIKIARAIMICLLIASCSRDNQALQKEYEEIASSFPTTFASGTEWPQNANFVYNREKELLLIECGGLDGHGIEIKDLSKLSIDEKIKELKFQKDNLGPSASPGGKEVLNIYMREAIYNYVNYGESFLVISYLIKKIWSFEDFKKEYGEFMRFHYNGNYPQSYCIDFIDKEGNHKFVYSSNKLRSIKEEDLITHPQLYGIGQLASGKFILMQRNEE